MKAGLAIVMLCFMASGFAGLVYEVAWGSEFALVFGTSELALATVLAAYLGGLGAGAALAAPLSRRVARPLLAYGLCELSIALSALAIPWASTGLRHLYSAWFGGQLLPPPAESLPTALFYTGGSFAILVVPTALMGATLPFLAEFAVQRDPELGARVGALYAVNTLGAAAGALASGFLLLPAQGIRRTVWIAAGLNSLLFLVAAFLSRSAAPRPRDHPTAPPAAAGRSGPFILPMMLVSGALALIYEVLWTRLLSHLLGSSSYAFSIMLGAFLLGIALGAAAAPRWAHSREQAARAFAWSQLGIGSSAVLSFAALRLLPTGAQASSWAPAALAGIELLPTALFLGATFPLAVRTLARRAEEAGSASGRIYAWNTVGAIVGAIGAGFWLLPGLGFAGTAALAAALNLTLAAAAALSFEPRMRVLVPLSCAGLAAMALLPPPTPWNILQASPLKGPHADGQVVFYSVGRSATVMLIKSEGEWQLRTNGLPEGSIQPPGNPISRYLVTRWLGALPALANPGARSMLVVGLGAGVALESVPRSVTSIDVIEIEPDVVRANRAVGRRRRRDPLADPRVHLILNDARSALMLTQKRYDAIVVQPSHPWIAGSAQFYTREFLQLARARLSARGMLVQWIGLPFIDAALLHTLSATLLDSFPHVRIYRPPTGHEILLLASMHPLEVRAGVERALGREPAPELLRIGIGSPEDLESALMLDQAGARQIGSSAPVNRDDLNLLQFRSRGGNRTLARDLGESLFARHDPLLGRAGAGLDTGYLVRRLVAHGLSVRAERLVRACRDPLRRQMGLAWLALGAGRPQLFEQLLEESWHIGSADPEVRAAVLRRERGAPSVAGSARLLPLSELERAVADGWQRQRRLQWEELRALEPALAGAAPTHPLYPDAIRLRAIWRLRANDPRLAEQAFRLLDGLLALLPDPEDQLLLAAAAAAAGHPRGALVALSDLSRYIAGYAAQAATAARALRLLDRLPLGPEERGWRAEVRARLANR